MHALCLRDPSVVGDCSYDNNFDEKKVERELDKS